jgi:hypothetical protein
LERAVVLEAAYAAPTAVRVLPGAVRVALAFLRAHVFTGFLAVALGLQAAELCRGMVRGTFQARLVVLAAADEQAGDERTSR